MAYEAQMCYERASQPGNSVRAYLALSHPWLVPEAKREIWLGDDVRLARRLRRDVAMKLSNAKLAALLLLLSGMNSLAEQIEVQPGKAPPESSSATEEELEEVIVRGERPNRTPSAIFNWLRRLLGEFKIDGYVDLRGDGRPEARLPVTGRAKCVPFGIAPAVHCDLNIDWPRPTGRDGEEITGGLSTLRPAVIVFAFEADRFAIRYLLVHSDGTADYGQDYLRGSTLAVTTRCVESAAKCQRVLRVTAKSDGGRVDIQRETLTESGHESRQSFVLSRLPSE
jgi:hypothetical protein